MKAVKSIVGAPFKAAASVSKKIFSGVKKAWKTITSSTVGRALLIAATIYLGGAAFGLWNSPFQAVNGAFVSPAAEAAGVTTGTAATESGTTLAGAGGGATTGTTAGSAAGETLGASAANDAAVADTMISEGAAGTSAGTGAGTESLGTIPSSGNLADAAVNYGGTDKAAGKGILNSYLNSPTSANPSWWAKQGDLTKFGLISGGMQAGGQMLASAFSPDAIDVAERQAELERENLAWRNDFLAKNFNVGDINLGRPVQGATPVYPYPAQPVTPTPARVPPMMPQGFIKSSMGR